MIESPAARAVCTIAIAMFWGSVTVLANDREGTSLEGGRRPVRVALYDDEGIGKSLASVVKVLGEHDDLKVDRLKAEDIRSGKLKGYDVVLLPGGRGRREAETLEASGREQIRAFVRDGGAYVGICAGAYLATCDYAWSLHILDARVVDKQHWARGIGDIALALTPEARQRLGAASDALTLHYYQGPLLAPADNAEIPDYVALARFDGEIARKGAPTGVMKGTTAIAAGRFGRGRVLCFSPHPELTPGQGALLYHGILWSADR